MRVGAGYPKETRKSDAIVPLVCWTDSRKTHRAEVFRSNSTSEGGTKPSNARVVGGYAELYRHSLDIEVAVIEHILVVAGNDAGHSISTSCRLVPIYVVFLIFVHSLHITRSSVAELLV